MVLPMLKDIIPLGFNSGLRWNTDRYKSQDHQAWVYRSLLNNKYTKKLVKGLEAASKRGDGQGIPDLKKQTISNFFGLIWNEAAQNVAHCKDMSPRAFFTACKEKHECASTVPDEAFYQFTMRAIHARKIFEDFQPGWKRSGGTSMSNAIVNFIDALSNEYDIRIGLEEQEKPPRERDMVKIQENMQLRTKNLNMRKIYFPMTLTSPHFQGSGEDKIYIDYEFTQARLADPAAGPAASNETQGTSANNPLLPSGDVDPYWQPSDGEEEGVDKYGQPWREPADAYSDDDEDEDAEDWEDDFLDDEDGDDEDVTVRDPANAQNDAEMGHLTATLALKEDQMELDE
ncbi:hypothetical protein PG993_008094 [Apiospora rasikravindrae]|uniref:Uncharacterized protein n=1 Tax=Apiospora rasikravindrae TaxID=990691 RepID=A0ABR1SZD2_9PEZI